MTFPLQTDGFSTSMFRDLDCIVYTSFGPHFPGVFSEVPYRRMDVWKEVDCPGSKAMGDSCFGDLDTEAPFLWKQQAVMSLRILQDFVTTTHEETHQDTLIAFLACTSWQTGGSFARV